MLKVFLKNSLLIILGSVVYSLGISFFLAPNQLASGGVTGISIIINSLTQIPTGTIVLIINIPLVLLGIWKFGFKFFYKTAVTVALSSVLINIFQTLPSMTDDLLLAGLAGGALLSIGIGIIFKAGATTGGTDILVRLLRLKYRHVKSGKIFLYMDAVVITAAALIFRDIDLALYATICVIIQSFVLDAVLYGTDGERLVYIISAKDELITKRILAGLAVGVTHIEGYGAFTNQNKKIIMCAIHKQFLPNLREIVNEIDDRSFMIVTSANEIYGEGFKHHNENDLL